MLKRTISVFILFLLMIFASGCSAFFSNSYRSEQDFQGNEKIDLDANVQVVQNYSELRRLIFGMVNSHAEEKELLFSGYTGNVVSDIASVCNAVKTESSYGAYCVDYISYDLRQIVSSYEANINISYLYTADELQILQTTSNLDSFGELLVAALEAESTKLVVRVNNGTADADAVQDLMQQTVRNHPLSISYMPKFNVRIFDGNTSQKIYDVSIQYDERIDNSGRLKEMKDTLTLIESNSKQDSIEKQLVAAAAALNELCNYEAGQESTPYQALIEHYADSQGISGAYKALCDCMGVECLVVSGIMEKQPHYWNIVKVEDSYYHMDISALDTLGGEGSLFLTDAEKQTDCWWNQAEYPECDGSLTYASVILFE